MSPQIPGRDDEEAKEEGKGRGGSQFLRSAAAVFGHTRGDGDEDEAPRQARLKRRARGIVRRRVRLSLPEIYLQLGAALAERKRFDEATDAFRHALTEGGIGAEDVLEDLGHSAESAGARDLALRAWLELSLIDADRSQELTARAGRLLDEDVAAAQGRWVLDRWRPRIEQRELSPAARFEVALLAARAAVFVGNDEMAIDLFGQAAKAAPEAARRATDKILAPDSLPARWRADNQRGHWLCARACAALGVNHKGIAQVDAALAAATPGEDLNFEIAALDLKARLLDAAQQPAEAVATLVHLGRRHDMLIEHAAAVEAYSQATKVDPENAEPWWYLADSRRLAAALAPDDPGYDDEIRRARDELNAGLAKRAPTTDEAWVYWAAALLAEETARLSDDEDELLFEAALFAEQAVALNPSVAGPWSLLVRYHRMLGNPAGALVALDQALQVDPTNDDVLQERASTLAELGLEPAERRADGTYDAGRALDELVALEQASAEADTRWVTAIAARARVLATDRRWLDAADAYQTLLAKATESPPGPQAAFAPARPRLVSMLLEETREAIATGEVDRLVAAHSRLSELGEASESTLSRRTGDLLLVLGRADEAVQTYKRCVAAMDETAVEDRAKLQTRLGIAAAASGDTSQALGLVRSALEIVRDRSGRTQAAQTVIGACADVTSVAGTPALFPMTLRKLLEDEGETRGQRRRLASAWFETVRSGQEADGGAANVISPLVLEADQQLFPAGAETEGVPELIEESIPAMRNRILEDTGVLIPGVLILTSQPLDRAFRVHLHGVPYTRADIPGGATLCTDAPACRERGLTGEPLPNAWLGDEAAIWLDRSSADEARTAGLPLLGVYDAMLWSLEGLVRIHLHRLIGLAEIDYMVEGWRVEDVVERSDRLAAALPDQRARVRFTAVVRALVRAGVSVADLGGLLDIFAASDTGPESVAETVEVARARMPSASEPALQSAEAFA